MKRRGRGQAKQTERRIAEQLLEPIAELIVEVRAFAHAYDELSFWSQASERDEEPAKAFRDHLETRRGMLDLAALRASRAIDAARAAQKKGRRS